MVALIVEAFDHYLSLSDTTIEPDDFNANLEEKLGHEGFRADLDQLLREPPAGYTLEGGATLVRNELISRIQ